MIGNDHQCSACVDSGPVSWTEQWNVNLAGMLPSGNKFVTGCSEWTYGGRSVRATTNASLILAQEKR
jgi:hypothetical protein